ncbi:MAG: asparagine synthase (glutamine-hydrolyzing) [Chitinivibrionales bacterium]|nr:asparagine synthase (glutamine-hydrolyzing) [Chitinivibrionales bacterium]
MCGICGMYNANLAPVDREVLNAMTDVLAHRGPNGRGTFIGDNVGLGHRRLSIIDLGGGAQPIANEDNSVTVVFNGEIYNYIELRRELYKHGHHFKTESDTETIVHAYEQWGDDCVDKFNGIFAFALWDERAGRLLLARDHLGVKPLYYFQAGEHLAFASEVKSLMQNPDCPVDVDIAALAHLFTYRFVPSPRTMFQGISKLPPGHLMVADSSGIAIRRHWNYRPEPLRNANEADLLDMYRSLVTDAVRLQLRSDVPVGLFFSSGVDSGMLLALMRELGGDPLYTFTIGFSGGERTNETDDAREVARRLGTRHTEMIVGPEDYMRYYERYLWDVEEPLGNETAVAFYFVSKIASERVKVALTGQGVDEPWGGYHRYLGVKLSQWYSRIPHALTRGIVRPLVEALPRNERLKRGVQSLDEGDILTRFTRIYSFYSEAMKARLFQPWLADDLASRPGADPREGVRNLQNDVAYLDPVAQMLYIDTRASLPDDLLMVCDKTSMANSIEARVPLLDRRIVELVESLPVDMKLRGFQGKYLHKRAALKWLPRQHVYRKKKGFENPVKEWLRGGMRPYVEECLLDPQSAVNHYFSRDYVSSMLDAHESGRESYMRHLYLLLSFEMWHRRFIGTPVAAAKRVSNEAVHDHR